MLLTEEILAGNSRFLVLAEDGRGWFDDLRAREPLSTTLLRRAAGCRLWSVERAAGSTAPGATGR